MIFFIIVILLGIALWVLDKYLKKDSSPFVSNTEKQQLQEEYNQLVQSKIQLQADFLNEKRQYEDQLSQISTDCHYEILKAEKNLEQKKAEINAELKEYKQNQQKEIDISITKKQAEIDKQKTEIKKLKSIKEDLLRAAAMADHKNEEKRLIIKKPNDKKDVDLLKSIENRISNPKIISKIIWSNYYLPLSKQLFPKIIGSSTGCGIYKITNIKNNKCYIGQSRDLYRRFQDHCKNGLGCGTSASTNKFYSAIQEEGLENFSFEILSLCPPEELNTKEREFIDYYKSVEFGYNTTKGNG